MATPTQALTFGDRRLQYRDDYVAVSRKALPSVELDGSELVFVGYDIVAPERGWNDYEQPLINEQGQAVDLEEADDYFTTKLKDDQVHPDRRPA